MLPKIFEPVHRTDLIRLGQKYDGGYLVATNSVMNTERLISLGVQFDWSFERDFRRLKYVPLEAYDHTVTPREAAIYLMKGTLNTLLEPRRITNLLKRVGAVLDYRFFFRDTARHHLKMVGYDLPGGTSLTSIVRQFPGERLFLKVDIEGWEYRILDEIVACADQLEGLAMELHDVDIHHARLEAFVRALPLSLVHVHANNHGGVDGRGDPVVLEMTFSRLPPSTQAEFVPLPHSRDQPNDPTLPEVELQFAD
ncbi:MAG: hypothetical protein WBA12_04190 [Catalinimonas sp.]